MSLTDFTFPFSLAALIGVMAAVQLFRCLEPKIKVSRIQLIILLIFSYCFICASDWRFGVCTLAVTTIAYVCGRMIDIARNKLPIVYGGSIVLLSILAYFKYTGFFVSSVAKLLHIKVDSLNNILPVGISFYVFSALSYILDVYRGKYRTEKDIIYFGLYISFFPKITAGPIVRYDEFKSQIKKYQGLDLQDLQDGLQIFFLGFFKKLVLADRLGIFVNDVFFAPSTFNTGTVILGAVSYSLQIYFDFSGYSDMAIGVSKMLGLSFQANFNLPYIAKNMSDFWRRWHISLSSWFRDYVYIPLGGSRTEQRRKIYVNLMLTMLLSGLWHGAGWTFILWGGIHGLASCISRWWSRRSRMKLPRFAGRALTYIVVTLLWVMFRAETISKGILYWKMMFTWHSGISQPYTWTFFSVACLVGSTIVAYRRCKAEGKKDIGGVYPVMDLSKISSMIVFFTFVGLTIILGYFGNTVFIYGKF